MYITECYWGDYIGGTDDSLTLTAYLACKGKAEIAVGEIFADFGLERLGGDFRRPEEPLFYRDEAGQEMALALAIDLVTDLAALLLECKVNGTIDLLALDDSLDAGEVAEPVIAIAAAPEEHRLIDRTLADFAAAPERYDISEMMGSEELAEMAGVCDRLRRELYE